MKTKLMRLLALVVAGVVTGTAVAATGESWKSAALLPMSSTPRTYTLVNERNLDWTSDDVFEDRYFGSGAYYLQFSITRGKAYTLTVKAVDSGEGLSVDVSDVSAYDWDKESYLPWFADSRDPDGTWRYVLRAEDWEYGDGTQDDPGHDKSGTMYVYVSGEIGNGVSVLLKEGWDECKTPDGICWYYEKTDAGAVLCGARNVLSGDVTLPSRLDEYDVTGIAQPAFYDNTNLTSVRIPASVTNIAASAFCGCRKMTNMTVLAWHEVFSRMSLLDTPRLRTLQFPNVAHDNWTDFAAFMYADSGVGERILSVEKAAQGCVVTLRTEEVRVRFDAGGGVCTEQERWLGLSTAVGDLPVPTRALYQFKGWYTAASGGTKVTSASVVSGDVTYYAQWKKDGKVALSVVSEDEKCGTVTGGNARYAPGEKVTVKATPKKAYCFVGWYDGTKRVSTKTSYSYKVGSSDVTLTARFAYDAIALDEPDDVECDVGEAIEVALSCASGTSVTYDVGGLPDGVAFDKKTLVIAGKPRKAGASTVKIVATNKSGNTASASFVINAGHLAKLTLTAETDDDAKGGSVSGGGYYEPGKKVTLKATAKKGYVFAGWSGLDEDRVKGGVDLRTAKISYVTADFDEAVCAYFVTASEDAASLSVSLKSLPRYDSSTEEWTDYEDFGGKLFVGVQTTQQVSAVSLSLPTVTVSGLPKGLTFNESTYEICGVPSKAGTYTVKVTASNVSGASVTERFTVTVAELPIWASGSYLGVARLTTYGRDDCRVCNYQGVAAATVSKTGKLSGYFTFKGKRYGFAEKGYAERVETVWRCCPVCGGGLKCSTVCDGNVPVEWYCPHCEEFHEESPELRVGTNVYYRVRPTVKVGSRTFAIPLRMEPGDGIASCGRLYFDDCDDYLELVKGGSAAEYAAGGRVSLGQTLVGRSDLGTLPAKTLKKCFRGEEGGEPLGEGDWISVKTLSTGATLVTGRLAGNAVSWSSAFVPTEANDDRLGGGTYLYAPPVSRTGFCGRSLYLTLEADLSGRSVAAEDVWDVEYSY